MSNYFDEKLISSAVMEFQSTGNFKIIDPFITSIQKLIRGVINSHELWKFWDTPLELENEGFKTVFECLLRFDPKKGYTLFNYLSLAVKWSLVNFTRDYNNRAADERPIDAYLENLLYYETKEDNFENILCESCDGKFNDICQQLKLAYDNDIHNEKDLIFWVMEKTSYTELMIKKALQCSKRRLNNG